MKRSLRGFVVSAFALTLCTAQLEARAQTAAQPGKSTSAAASANGDAVTQARQHFTRAVKLYEEDDFRAALIEFSRTYELAPNWQVLFNIGQSYYQLRDYANALRTLEKYVAQGGAQIAADRRATVEREMDELRGRVAHVTLTSNVTDAEVSLDDAPLGKTPFAEAVLIGAGRHRVTVAKRGYLTTTKIVDIAGGDALTLPLELTEEPHAAPSGAAPLAASTPREGGSHAAPILSFVVGGAGLVVGSVFGILAVNDKSALTDACRNKVCPASSQGTIDAFSRDGTISTVGFGVGAAGIALGAILLLGERSADEAAPAAAPPPETSRPSVRPWIGLGGAGLSGVF